jgi:hypothetical protein
VRLLALEFCQQDDALASRWLRNSGADRKAKAPAAKAIARDPADRSISDDSEVANALVRRARRGQQMQSSEACAINNC